MRLKSSRVDTREIDFHWQHKNSYVKNVKECCIYLWLSVGAFELSIRRILKNFSILLLSRRAKSVIIQNGVVCSSCHIIAYLNIPRFFVY